MKLLNNVLMFLYQFLITITIYCEFIATIDIIKYIKLLKRH